MARVEQEEAGGRGLAELVQGDRPVEIRVGRRDRLGNVEQSVSGATL